MSPTSYTAFILTIHDLGFFASFFLATFVSVVIFLTFLRKKSSPWLKGLAIFLLTMVFSLFACDEALEQQPIKLEVVRAG